MKKKLISFLKDEEGIETMEYALIAALIAIASITAAVFLGTETNEMYSSVGAELDTHN